MKGRSIQRIEVVNEKWARIIPMPGYELDPVVGVSANTHFHQQSRTLKR